MNQNGSKSGDGFAKRDEIGSGGCIASTSLVVSPDLKPVEHHREGINAKDETTNPVLISSMKSETSDSCLGNSVVVFKLVLNSRPTFLQTLLFVQIVVVANSIQERQSTYLHRNAECDSDNHALRPFSVSSFSQFSHCSLSDFEFCIRFRSVFHVCYYSFFHIVVKYELSKQRH